LQDILEGDGHIAVGGGQKGTMLSPTLIGVQDPFGVVITDLGMPHVDGRRLAASVKIVSPDNARLPAHRLGQANAGGGRGYTKHRPCSQQATAIADIQTALAGVSAELVQTSQA
jgi:hypothetical protein